jgi:hypothetical protein
VHIVEFEFAAKKKNRVSERHDCGDGLSAASWINDVTSSLSSTTHNTIRARHEDAGAAASRQLSIGCVRDASSTRTSVHARLHREAYNDVLGSVGLQAMNREMHAYNLRLAVVLH